MSHEDIERRSFLQTAGTVGAFTILQSRLVRGAQANSAVRMGLLGCGSRGSVHAANIIQNTDGHLVALGDLFQDQLDRAKQRFDQLNQSKGRAAISQTFVGPRAFEEMAQAKELDAIVIATPPYFHPQHLAAVVAAGKHVYCEKPVSVDVPGAMQVLEIGKRAEGKLSLDVGFQIRSAPPFVEMVRRIHAGALGDIVAGEAHYWTGSGGPRNRPGVTGQQLRLRNWGQDRILGGDIIVEQDIHVIDICNWVLKGHPVKAVGAAGRKGRMTPGTTVHSYFDVIYYYPNEVHVSFNATQFGKPAFDASEHFYGTLGSSESPYSGRLGITGESPWIAEGSDRAKPAEFSGSGAFLDNLALADREKQRGFIASITSGQFHNQAATGVDSALSAMLGREAAYSGREMTWDELLRANKHLDAGIDVNNLG